MHYYRLLSAQQGQQQGQQQQQSGSSTPSDLLSSGSQDENKRIVTTETGSSTIREKALARAKARSKNAPPFVWSHEILRGLISTVIVAVGYLLMLAVMVSDVKAK
jgi:hypothetical protein